MCQLKIDGESGGAVMQCIESMCGGGRPHTATSRFYNKTFLDLLGMTVAGQPELLHKCGPFWRENCLQMYILAK